MRFARATTALLLAALALAPAAWGKSRKPASTSETAPVADRVSGLEDRVEKLEDELEIIKAQSRLLIKHTTLSQMDAFYLKAALSILVPRESSFGFHTDTGLGAHLGAGKYLGRIHVLELTADWDFYPALSFRYRIEYHNTNPSLTLAPVIGIKQKIASIRPFDNFLADPSAVKGTFAIVGLLLGVPLGKSVLAMETDALFNGQFTLTMTVGINFFF